MLILTRKIGEKIIINDDIEIIVVDSNSSSAKIGINAPKSVRVFREELYKEIKSANTNSNTASIDVLNELQSLLNTKETAAPDSSAAIIEKFTTKLNDE